MRNNQYNLSLKAMTKLDILHCSLYEKQIRSFFFNTISKSIHLFGHRNTLTISEAHNINGENNTLKKNVELSWHLTSKMLSADFQYFYDKKAEIKKQIDVQINYLDKNNCLKSAECLRHIRRELKLLRDIEFDGIIFVFDKTDFSKEHVIIISLEREVKLRTPFCIITQAKLQGPTFTLEVKIEQLIRQLIFFTTCFKLIKHRFIEGNTIEALIANGNMNIYPFIIVDGKYEKLHQNFDSLKDYQSHDIMSAFKFYKMIKGVADSSINPIKQFQTKRVKNQFLIDLFHIEHQYGSKKLYNSIYQLNKQINNTLDELKIDVNKLKSDVNELKDYMNKKIDNECKYDMNQLKSDVNELKDYMNKKIDNECKYDMNQLKSDVNETKDDVNKKIDNKFKYDMNQIKSDVNDLKDVVNKKIDKLIKRQDKIQIFLYIYAVFIAVIIVFFLHQEFRLGTVRMY